jgi:hypothetical protein
MLDKNSVVAIFDQHTRAEEAVKQLQQAGFDMKSCRSSGKDITRKRTSSAITPPASG